MAAAYLSTEEENYVRMSLLITGISPRGVRALFDSEFAPICLGASIKKEYTKLKELKSKHIINQSQLNLLFPRYPDVPDSKTFDVTLMITLLRHLTPMIPPAGGYDCLPQTAEVTQGADLARIKYYRNYLAHLDNGKIDTTFFNTAWIDITSALVRFGGHKMKQDCDQLKIKHLDQTSQEIMNAIRRSSDEIRELKASVEYLQSSEKEMKKSYDLLQENYEEVQHSHVKLQKTVTSYQQDTVPWNVRAQNNKILEKWKTKDQMFVNTRAAKHVLQSLQENSCVTVTASSGVGKTAIIQHVALEMDVIGYDILLVTDPGDIVKFYNPNKKTLFVIDDLCGNFSLNKIDIKIWEPVVSRIKECLEDKHTKIIAACRLQVYLDDKFDTLSMFKSCVCNLLSDTIRLLIPEKQSIAEVYLKTKAYQVTDYYDLYDCFPLLCQLYHENPTLDLRDLFQNPFSVYEAQVDELQKKGIYAKYCALALCVVFNNKVNEDMLTLEIREETRTIIENTCEACKLERGTSRLLLKDEMDSLLNTFLQKQGTSFRYLENQIFYTTMHDKVFDILVKYFGQKLFDCLIKNADSGLIRERFLLDRKDDMDQFITIVPSKYHQLYMQRMIDDWSKGKLQDVFNNNNMKIYQFRQRFLNYLNKYDISFQKKLVHTVDLNSNKYNSVGNLGYDKDVICDTVMLQCCFIGDIPMILFCLGHDASMDQCGYRGQFPLMIACRYGHTEVVRMLLNKGADYNKCDNQGWSPVLIACVHGDKDILRLLIEKGADYTKCNKIGQSAVMLACLNGHTEIVKMLLDKGADCNECDSYHQSLVMIASRDGNKEIVKMLLDRYADFNKCDILGKTPVMMACIHGHTDILRMLLDKGANYNRCDTFDESPVIMACIHGNTKIVRMLLDKGVKCNTVDKYGQSLVMNACIHGHTDIVSMLLNRGADFTKFDRDGRSLVMACIYGYTEIERMLDKGTAYDNTYDKCGNHYRSLVMTACQRGHVEIVKMLLHKGVNYNTFDYYGQSPLMMSCEHGKTEIVTILLDNGADYDKCNKVGHTPLSIACRHGHTEIVRVLLDKGACYDNVTIIESQLL